MINLAGMDTLLGRLNLDNKKMLLIAVAFMVLLYLDFNFIMKIQIRGIKEASPKIAKITKDIDTLNRDLASIQAEKRKESGNLKKEAFKAKKLITEDQIPALLEYISNVANQNNVKIVQIKPAKELKAKEDKAAKETPPFSSLLITLDLSGDYHRFGAFLNNLEKAETFIGLADLRIIRDTKDNFNQDINLVLRTYVKK